MSEVEISQSMEQRLEEIKIGIAEMIIEARVKDMQMARIGTRVVIIGPSTIEAKARIGFQIRSGPQMRIGLQRSGPSMPSGQQIPLGLRKRRKARCQPRRYG